jgi:hypothetical protein
MDTLRDAGALELGDGREDGTPEAGRLALWRRSRHSSWTNSQSLSKTFIMRPSTFPLTVAICPGRSEAVSSPFPTLNTHWTTGISNSRPVPRVTYGLPSSSVFIASTIPRTCTTFPLYT